MTARLQIGGMIAATLIAASGLGGCAGDARVAAPDATAIAAVSPVISTLHVSTTRSTSLTGWVPAHPRGVALFSTGHGSWPERHGKLAAALTAEGFVPLAPLHVASVHFADREKFTRERTFTERLADMRATAGFARKTYPALPVVAIWHSFGSLIAATEGRALAGVGPFRVPSVKATLAFSTPGLIPELIQPDAYASLAVPIMVITGTRDTLLEGLGYPNKPDDHLLPARSAPSGTYALVVGGADHGLIDDTAMLARALPAVRPYLKAYGLDDCSTRMKLDNWRDAPGDQFIWRNKAS